MLSLVNDVTEKVKAERELRESEEKFALAFNSSPDAVNINRLEDGFYVRALASDYPSVMVLYKTLTVKFMLRVSRGKDQPSLLSCL